jgi:hypothetical protein
VISPGSVVANLIVGHEAPAASFAQTRSVNVPGIEVSVEEMVAALRRVAGDATADRVKWRLDPVIDRIVQTWPTCFAAVLGPKLGMRADPDFDSIVRAHVAEHPPR